MDEVRPFALRLPEDLKRALEDLKEEKERSLNWLIVDAIRKYLAVPR